MFLTITYFINDLYIFFLKKKTFKNLPSFWKKNIFYYKVRDYQSNIYLKITILYLIIY